jgi:hypothetical protein
MENQQIEIVKKINCNEWILLSAVNICIAEISPLPLFVISAVADR